MMRSISALVAFFWVFTFSPLAADKLPGCAVMTFEAKNGVSKEESAVLADGLESELIELKRYRMVSRANLGKVLEAQKVSMECAGTECAIEAGRIAAIEFVVFGSIGKVGETYSLVANLANVETGVIEQTAKITQSGKIDQLLVSGVGLAAKKIVGVDTSETCSTSAPSDRRMEELTATSTRCDTPDEVTRPRPNSYGKVEESNGEERNPYMVEEKTVKPAVPAPKSYTIKEGDSLGFIAQRFKTTIHEILALNPSIKKDTGIRVGQSIKLPAYVDLKAPAPKKPSRPKPVVMPVEATNLDVEGTSPPALMEEYVVVNGDYPEKIAKKCRVKMDDLLKANKITDPKKLKIGQKLVIPRTPELAP